MKEWSRSKFRHYITHIMRNFFFLFVGGLVLVSVVTFLNNKHFFNFVELSPTDDDVLSANPLKTTVKYLKLAQQWPPSHCNIMKKKNCEISPLPKDFTIHGLWPDERRCTGPPYTKITDSGLLKKLKKEWPDLQRADNQEFWKHEWTEHGTCSNMDQTTYFDITLKLKSRYNILKHLVDNGIEPRNDTPYPVKKIRKLVKALTKANPDLNCNEDRNNNPQLHEVRICFDAYKEVTDCTTGNNCNDHENVYFPLN